MSSSQNNVQPPVLLLSHLKQVALVAAVRGVFSGIDEGIEYDRDAIAAYDALVEANEQGSDSEFVDARDWAGKRVWDVFELFTVSDLLNVIDSDVECVVSRLQMFAQ